MPFVNYTLASNVPEATMVRLKQQTADIIRRHTGKEEQWLLVRTAGEQPLYFKGSRLDNGGVVEIKLVGTLTPEKKKEIVRGITSMLTQELGTEPDSLYVIFSEVKAEDWGWNSTTFA